MRNNNEILSKSVIGGSIMQEFSFREDGEDFNNYSSFIPYTS
jgi:hypothetical protein